MPARHPAIDPLTSRRTALSGALAGLVAVTGCDAEPGSEDPAPDQTTAPAVDADAGLVEQVVESILSTGAIVDLARGSSAELRRRLRPLVDLHAAHLEALDPFDGTYETLTDGRPDLQQVRRAEALLQRHLVGASVRADSGALAKLFASMAAAVAQHLAVLR